MMAAAYVLLHAVHLLCVTVLVGFMAVVRWTVVPAQDRLDGPGYARFEQQMNVPLQRLTPALLLTGIAAGAGAGLLALLMGSPIGWAHLAVAVALVAMTASTLLVNAPVNRAIDAWDPDAPPPDWMSLRDRWERGHAIRVAIGLPALVLGIAAAVL